MTVSRLKVIGVLLVLGLAMAVYAADVREKSQQPVRVVLIGLVHDHVNGFLPAISKADWGKKIELVGIYEPNAAVVQAYVKMGLVDQKLVYGELGEMLRELKPAAAMVFSSTLEHRSIVEACAAQHVHVMVEKPLAVSMEEAKRIKAAAEKGQIHVLVNYETSWYPSFHYIHELAVEKKEFGPIRKIVMRAGHQGPKEIGCGPIFLSWLTDPVKNGGGAMMDFGCYGADLMLWLMDGQKPTAVWAVAGHYKPQVYPKVEDDATIVLEWPGAVGIIEASWNWPFSRKDMDVYGVTGAVYGPSAGAVRIVRDGKDFQEAAPAIDQAYGNAVSYLCAVVRGDIKPGGLSGLEMNMAVTEILDAARESAATGKKVYLDGE